MGDPDLCGKPDQGFAVLHAQACQALAEALFFFLIQAGRLIIGRLAFHLSVVVCSATVQQYNQTWSEHARALPALLSPAF